MIAPDPPTPFHPEVETLTSGSALYRVHGNGRGPVEFNGSGVGSSRFAFFRSLAGPEPDAGAIVPVLYAAETESSAVAETLLHDIPTAGGVLPFDEYASKVLNRIITTRPLRLAKFHGLGLRRLRIEASQLTDTERSEYHRTVLWAAAAHAHSGESGALDGISWMSKRCNSDRAYVFFGDRVAEGDFVVDASYGRVFADIPGVSWLSDLCAPLGVDVVND